MLIASPRGEAAAVFRRRASALRKRARASTPFAPRLTMKASPVARPWLSALTSALLRCSTSRPRGESGEPRLGGVSIARVRVGGLRAQGHVEEEVLAREQDVVVDRRVLVRGGAADLWAQSSAEITARYNFLRGSAPLAFSLTVSMRHALPGSRTLLRYASLAPPP